MIEPPAAGPEAAPPEAVQALLDGRYGDPFAVLGLHGEPGGFVARAIVPGAEAVEACTLAGEPLGALDRVANTDFFEGRVSAAARQPVLLRARRGENMWGIVDPYSFGPVLGPVDDYLIGEGSHERLFDKFGAHPIEHEGASGVHFAVWAPNAERVSVVGDWNHWDPRRHVMRRRGETGVWEIFLPDIAAGASYKYEITGAGGLRVPQKADPFGFQAELRPATASVVAPVPAHGWSDAAHRSFWRQADPRRLPISIYEVHAGSWRRRADGSFLSWDELAAALIPYVVDMGFTHIEFMPVSEHPYDPSWGYQPVGLFAPSSRFGDPDGFARLVEGAHRAGLGIIIDWVPAHFPTDAHGLARFDGTHLYEHQDPRQGFHPDWNTAIYNFGRREVASFLVNNALFWADRYHVDGLRVDAVASMLYLDYSREPGQWVPNDRGGNENLEAVEFLRRVNAAIYREHPGIMTIAEESTSWPGVSKPVHDGGLGFGLKWNMGWMHDTLQYLGREAVHRSHHHGEMTFGLVYAFSENFVLPLSHDEVVHGKGSLLAKMAGDEWQKFASLRAFYGFMWGYPGKKLLFMGGEFAQRREWSEARPLDWELLDAPAHDGVRQFVRDLNALYRTRPALHARDCEDEGFRWLVVDDRAHSVFAWERRAPGEPPVVVVTNFTPVPRHDYPLPLPRDGRWREILNSDAASYGGGGHGNFGTVTCRDGTARLTIPPLATLMLEPEGQ